MLVRRHDPGKAFPGRRTGSIPGGPIPPDAGVSLLELILVLSLFGTLTAIALALVLQSYKGVQLRLSTSTLFDSGTMALNQMTKELRMAGYPSAKAFTSSAVASYPGLVATPFITVTAYDVVFQSATQQNGIVEQIEYVIAPGSQNLYRNSTQKNLNGSLQASTVQTLLLNNVQNRISGTPLFTWNTNPSDTQSFPLNVQSVYINMVLQSTSNESGSPASVTLTATCPRINF
jgi:prepilin-type N-terminal cleavage/methylation domain-containing protein